MYERTALLPVSVDNALAWHARPGAFSRLIPPWQPVLLVKPNDGIGAGATLTMRLPLAGPLGVTWHALHEAPQGFRGFRDVQARGPFNRWEHDHVFEEAGAGASRLVDRVSYRLPLWPISQPVAGWAVRRMLDRMFTYRQDTTRADLARHASLAGGAPMTVAVTGASGLVGQALTAFLSTGGHRVLRLVRREARSADEVSWNPDDAGWDATALEGIDAVVHLAGENIAGRRWSDAHKARVRESRVRSTESLVTALSQLARPPRALVCASAIGYYGASREDSLTEESPAGGGFMAEVCEAWEGAALAAEARGMRVAILRIGVVMSPLGGALAKMMPAFLAGVGGPVGKGSQHMSWIGLDDVVYATHFVLSREDARGPFNLTAPTPVTNREFARTLGRVLHRPAILPLPAAAVRALFGEMGDALLLGSLDVRPRRLEGLGFRFEYPELEGALRHVLGRAAAR